MRIETNVSTIVIRMVEAMPKYRLAARSIERFGVDERDGVVGDLGEDAVERRDQEVDPEAGRDAGERGCHARRAGCARRS